MRLLHAYSLAFREFLGEDVPPYAILSHTWGEEEVTFTDMIENRATGLKGYPKILGCCELAWSEGFEYWVDTCCIDKRSSAELSEAINSMFRWYQKSAVCYAYLDDYRMEAIRDDGSYGDELSGPKTIRKRPKFHYTTGLRACRWFTRGWTLQELIAPSFVVFYSGNWSYIGTRNSLKDIITKITGISASALKGGYPKGFSVAEKMSWASERKTTRPEDEAYCLLGLFGVSIPLVYGEGIRAFRRFQEEIIKYSDDETIFAHDPIGQDLLARSPTAFSKNDSFRCSDNRVFTSVSPFSITNKGIQISLPLIEESAVDELWRTPLPRIRAKRLLAVLNCYREGDRDNYIAFFITETKDRGIYEKSFHNFIPISAEFVVKYATVKRILIRVNNDENYRILERAPAQRRVLLKEFPAVLDQVTFISLMSRDHYDLKKHSHSNGVVVDVSVRKGFIKFESGQITEGEPTALLYRTEQGCDFLISLGFMNEETLIAAIGCTWLDTSEKYAWYLIRPGSAERVLHEAKRLLERSLIKPTIAYLPEKDSATESLAMTVRVQNAGHVPVVTTHAERHHAQNDTTDR
ncbi:hypothetical protein O1611_g1838 [Lasiodiplodia mahajangana]|uniref:Uncharacterized protein n=1 Tax=Lasiodiplodia mahajangana TaxID=1108764 RepID=A0ACC2JWL2_9PEZI|nr:hypothetical protein O1611_g1838 [Lasiodiplodia mahajangana]